MTDFTQYRYVDTISRKNKLMRLVWGIVWLLLFRPSPRWALHGWRRFLLRQFGAKIGEGSRIAPTCRVWAPWNLEMGNLSVLADHVDCYTMDKIRIGSKVAVSQRTFLCSGSHRTDSLIRELITAPITIDDHAWIAAECFIHPGTHIGEGCVVGARSVVTKDLRAWTICAGIPCKTIKERKITSL